MKWCANLGVISLLIGNSFLLVFSFLGDRSILHSAPFSLHCRLRRGIHTKIGSIVDSIGNMFSGSGGGNNVRSSIDYSGISTDSAPSWQQIDDRLRSIEPATEREEFQLKATGRGGANHKSNIRLFDAPDGFEPQVTLYRDAAAWCPYCEKVWLQLEEKRIPYKIEKVPLRCYGEKPRSFYAINPGGGLPVATIKGKTLAESNDIMNCLEVEFPDTKPLLPDPQQQPGQYARVSPLLRLERQAFSVWFRWLTSGAGASAAAQMDTVLKEVDHALKQSPGPYFLGDDLSLVDIMFTPFLERMAASLPFYKGFETRSSKYPNLLRWYEAMDTRPAYQGIKSDYYTHCMDLPPQIGGCVSAPGCEPYQEAIGGGDWTLDKSPDQCFEPMLPLCSDTARREIVRTVVSNHAALIRFTARGAGKRRGGATVSAILADPNATPYEEIVPILDAILRLIMTDILSVVESETNASTETWLQQLNEAAVAKSIVSCLIYLRDRIGVPRDLSVHAARLFRAHINSFVSKVETAV